MKAIFLILTLVSTTVFAQTDEPAVKEVINKLFQGMKTTDTAMIRSVFSTVKIDSDLAMVWAPYKFYVGEKFSHCGVDCFQLVKLNGQWKIQYLIDTRRRQGCE
jgi:hypothetical protein